MEDPAYPSQANPWAYLPPGMGAQPTGILAGLMQPGGLLGQSFNQRMGNWNRAVSDARAGGAGLLDAINTAAAQGDMPQMDIMGSVVPSGRLPMDYASRMQRANQQGFTTTAYKGAYPYDPETVPLENWRGVVIGGADRVPQLLREFNNPNQPWAGFFSDDVGVANRFARAFNEGAVFPVRLRLDRPHIIDAGGRFAADFQFGNNGGMIQRLFENPQIDSVILRNTRDEGNVFIPRTPQQVRSVNARFDPRRISSPDMLAGALPFGILGGYGLLGGDR